MKLGKAISTFICIAAAVAALSSCKKKGGEEMLYFNGRLQIHGGRSIIGQGEAFTFTADGLTGTEGLDLTYKWTVTDRQKADTSRLAKGEWKYTFPKDGLKTYTVTCAVSAEGYYSASASTTLTMVKPGPEGSIPEIFNESDTDFVTDEDGKQYSYVKVGDLYWMTRNLGTSKSGISYFDAPVMDDIVGKFYNYEEALTACPEGWRLPTDAEWMSAAQLLTEDTLAEHETWKGVCGGFMIYANFNEYKLWDFWPEVDVTNELDLRVIPVGLANTETHSFESFNEQAVFWTADERNEEQAFVRYIVETVPDMYSMAAHKTSFGASVRCVKDAE
ncbi:MAG: fibrobacter succinogenes major paralogous domain-containing protein [Bacteroidales bacterium]|nr:fibrobacter succinogenes major paralogous domain-containing protein [Bacteroidales bacterium]